MFYRDLFLASLVAGIRSRMIAWDFVEQVRLLSVLLFEGLQGRFVV